MDLTSKKTNCLEMMDVTKGKNGVMLAVKYNQHCKYQLALNSSGDKSVPSYKTFQLLKINFINSSFHSFLIDFFFQYFRRKFLAAAQKTLIRLLTKPK